jgi:GAF domain-containing protein
MVGISEQQDLDEAIAATLSSLDVLARALHVKDARLQPTLDAIVSAAASVLGPGREAGLILMVHGRLVPQATLGRAPLYLDLHQQETGEGPCIEAAQLQVVIRIDDTRGDSRWPGFCAEAQKYGVLSQLCVPLQVDEQSMGSLSLYAGAPAAFTPTDERVTTVFATLAALALAEALRTEQMRAAVAGRDLIGQAKGILMERHRMTANAAFSRLARISQDRNMKLSEVAGHLVATGELLGSPQAGHKPPAAGPTTRP